MKETEKKKTATKDRSPKKSVAKSQPRKKNITKKQSPKKPVVENRFAKESKTKDRPPKKKVVKKKHPGKMTLSIFAMLLWVAASVIASQYVIGYIMVWTMGSDGASTPLATAIYSALSYVLAMILIILVPACAASKMKKKRGSKKDKTKESKQELVGANRKTLGLQGLPTWTDVGLAPVGFIIYALLAAGLIALFNLIPWFNATQEQDVGFSYLITGFDRSLAFFTLVVIAPIAEEVIFRGWLYGKMREKIASEYSNLVSIIVSILLVSILFGAVHGQWNVGVNVFALSIVLCGLREITGTIYAGMFLHILKNGVAFWLIYMI